MLYKKVLSLVIPLLASLSLSSCARKAYYDISPGADVIVRLPGT